MKKLNYLLLVIFMLSSLTTFAEEAKVPKRIAEKCSQMKEQIKTDLQLTDDEAAKYEQLILEKFAKDAVELKKLDNDEAKKEYRKESSKEFGKELKEAFGEEKGKAIQKWTGENQKNFPKENK